MYKWLLSLNIIRESFKKGLFKGVKGNPSEISNTMK